MEKVLSFLRECGTFFLATTDRRLPHVRPFGVVTIMEGRLYLCTNNTKDCYRQIMDNPQVELCGEKDHYWIRISGELKRDTRPEARRQFLLDCPLPYYQFDDGIFEVFYFSSMTVRYYKDLELEETVHFSC